MFVAMGTVRSPKRKRPRVGGEEVARICHALSDGTRLAILDRLRHGEQCVCNLVDVLGGGQSRLSFHLKTLKDAGLVRDRRDGRWVHYSIDPEALALLHGFVAWLEGASGDAREGGSCC